MTCTGSWLNGLYICRQARRHQLKKPRAGDSCGSFDRVEYAVIGLNSGKARGTRRREAAEMDCCVILMM